MRSLLILTAIFLEGITGLSQPFLRFNQVGYLPEETKVALALSGDALAGAFEVWRVGAEEPAFRGEIRNASRRGWGDFAP